MILLLVAAQAPLHADWLVLTSGERIETRGAWELKSNAVLFTSMRGQFSSVQAGDVDVEASRKLTEESQKAAEHHSARKGQTDHGDLLDVQRSIRKNDSK